MQAILLICNDKGLLYRAKILNTVSFVPMCMIFKYYLSAQLKLKALFHVLLTVLGKCIHLRFSGYSLDILCTQNNTNKIVLKLLDEQY